ncbi:BglG family transcription antiterminator [Abyssisolibacter fermentans]|uniref:BglG family transcription antiterminator n=1 Tax=Abyssisolibacter fermentans TaxID=1766203 RepID=UPI00082D4DBE|nr:BglG family transcription antiterminator [Abyssisolibacter fermentans]
MYYLKKRQIEIIEYLLHKKEYVSVGEIAEDFNVSSRTIHYDLEIIADWLKENKVVLEKTPSKGVMIKSVKDRNMLIEELKFLSVENRVLSDKERIRYIVLAFFNQQNPLNIDTLKNELMVSRNTVIKALKDVKIYLEEYNLILEKISGKGLKIVGKEKDIRDMMVDIFAETLSIKSLILYIENENFNENFKKIFGNYNKVFEIKDLNKVFKILSDVQDKYHLNLTDAMFLKMALYLIVSVKRIALGDTYDKFPYRVTEEQNYEVAQYIADSILIYYETQMSKNEVVGIIGQLSELKSYNYLKDLEDMNVSLKVDNETIIYTRHIIKYFETEMDIKLTQDNILYNGLALHIQKLIKRIKRNKQLKEGYTKDVKEKFPFEFQIAKESVALMEENFGCEIIEDEISFIVFYIRATYERLYTKEYSARALLICTEGVGVLSYITVRLKKEFPELDFIGTCSIYDYQRYKSQVDFVIATEVYQLSDIDVVHITPFLKLGELVEIRKVLRRLNKFKQISKYSHSKRLGEEKVIMLKDLIDESSVKLQVEAKDWKDSITKAGSILLDKGCIKQEYIDNMIDAVDNLGPYIVIMPGIAFAHARPDTSVKKTCMSIITLKEPVEFGSELNDPVSIVFAFGAESGGAHMEALQDIAKFLSVDENIEFCKTCKDKEVFLNKLLMY